MSRKNTIELTDAQFKAVLARNSAGTYTEPKKRQNALKSNPGAKQRHSEGEETLAIQLDDAGITGWTREFIFAAPRKWRADFAFHDDRLLVEVEGGHYINGRHNRGSGFEKDLEKYNAATQHNWAVMRFTTKMVKNGEAIAAIKAYLNRR